jgi:hypothetical protein
MIVKATRNEELKNKTLFLNNQLANYFKGVDFFEQEIRTRFIKNTKEMGEAVSACVVIIKDEWNEKECLNWKHY